MLVISKFGITVDKPLTPAFIGSVCLCRKGTSASYFSVSAFNFCFCCAVKLALGADAGAKAPLGVSICEVISSGLLIGATSVVGVAGAAVLPFASRWVNMSVSARPASLAPARLYLYLLAR